MNVPRYDIAPNLNADTDPATATVTPDIETTLYKSGGERYKLNKVEIELPNGEVKELESDGNNSYTYPVSGASLTRLWPTTRPLRWCIT